MEIPQLQLLRELGELGSVKAVAETMLVTPSAVSQQLSQLQRSVDVPLTRKEGRRLILTDAGEVLAQAGAEVVAAMARAHAAIDAFHQAPDASVSVSGFHSAGQALFAPLARLLSGPGEPRVRFQDEDVAQSDFPALTARHDLVLAHRMEHSPPWPRDRVAVIELAKEPLDVALPAGHHLAAKSELGAADLAGERWVTSRPGYSPDDVLQAISALASSPPRIEHRVNDYATVAALVADAGVVGLLPRFTSRGAARESADVVLRPLRGLDTRRCIDLLARPEALERRSVQSVVAAFRAAMAELMSAGEGALA